jgi:putative membrane protein
MLVTGAVFACIAAVIHVYIFILESWRWTAPRTRAVFGTTEAEAQTTRVLAYNQGFYNLFLAIISLTGVIVIATGSTGIGAALVLSACGSMLGAALVLLTSGPGRGRAAAIQGATPLLAVLCTVIGLL